MLEVLVPKTNPASEVAMRLPRSSALPASCGILFSMWCATLLVAQAPAARAAVPDELAASRARLAAETYVTPPEEIARLVTAPRHLNFSLSRPSPDRRYFVREVPVVPEVKSFGKPHYYLGGLQVDPAANRTRALTTRGGAELSLLDATTGKALPIQIPPGATVSSPVWAPDSRQIAYIANFEKASHVYLADVTTGKSRPLTKTPLLATLVTGIEFTGDGGGIVAVLLPDNRPAEPVRPVVAAGPRVQVWTDSLKSPQRQFFSLLEDPHDQALLEYYTTGQLAVIDLKTRTARRLGAPAMIRAVDPSPDGKYFRVTTMRRPFSYVVQYSNFGQLEQIWDGSGKVMAEVSKRPLREAPDTGNADDDDERQAASGKRSLAWLPRGDGLSYLEAARGRADTAEGSGQRGGSTRPDRVMKWLPPFGPGDTAVVHRADGPIAQLGWSEDATTIFVASTRSGTGELYAVKVADPDKKLSIVRQRGYTPQISGLGGGGFGGGGGRGGNANDSLSFYNNPGSLMTRSSPGGTVVMLSSDGAVYLSGTRYQRNYLENAPQGFVDRVVLATGAKTRVFEAAPGATESVSIALDDDLTRAIVVRETPTEVQQSYLRDMKTGSATRLTDNKDVTPDFTALTRKRIVVTRADGIKFVAKVTLPANYQAGTRLPGMFWLYPYEYTDQAGYDRTLRTENVAQYPTSGPRTIEFLATQGYAVANFNPPIIGDPGRMNDNYISDLRMNLLAVIDELDRQGYIDRSRLGIGGHSYGAFSTANAMVHTPFFKAGIAGDGMYNRTLTPTGFQSERRDLWSGQKTYLDMSPMLYADKMQGALLMYHGLEDQNVGTNPISSIRMMQALRSEGKVAALYLYPYEDHGPATKETLLDLWGRWTAWLDIYVKGVSKARITS